MSVIPQLKRNGFKGDFYGISPLRLFKTLLADPRMGTLMKAGEIEEMKYFLSNPCNADEFWALYLIAKRHRYHINNIGMWCDYLRMLKNLGKDLRNPVQDEKSTTNTTIATLTGLYSPVWLVLSKSADNAIHLFLFSISCRIGEGNT